MKNILNTAVVAASLAFSPAFVASADAAVAQLSSNGPVAASPVAPLAVSSTVVDFDVSGIFSYDLPGDPLNEVFTIAIGSSSRVIGIGWDVTIFADAPSWLSEATVTFGSSSSGFVDLTVGVGDDLPGTASYSSGGIINIVDLGLDFSVDADGLLVLEFSESFDDFIDDYDAIWESGTLSIEYQPAEAMIPEPATWAMLITGFGLVGFAARRRRSMVAQG